MKKVSYLLAALSVLSIVLWVFLLSNKYGCYFPEAECKPAASSKCGAVASQPEASDASVEGQIVLFGDSITASWPAGHWPTNTINTAIAGEKACSFDHVAVAGYYRPKLAYIHLGVNDTGDTDAASIWACYQQVIAQIQIEFPGIHVKILSNIPVGSGHATCEATNAKLASLRSLIASSGYDYLDTSSGMTCGGTCGSYQVLCATYTSDSLHLVAAGYNAWAALIGLP